MKRKIFAIGVIALLGAVFLAACANTLSNGPAGSTTVQISLTDFHIASSVHDFRPGKPYHFVITNNGHVTHEFMIMPSNAQVSTGTMNMSQMDKLALAYSEDIAPGTTKILNYTFPTSTQSTQPQFACYYLGHYEAGMHTRVKVSST